MVPCFCYIIIFFLAKVFFFASKKFAYLRIDKIAPQKVSGQFPVKCQRFSLFYVHFHTFLLVFEKSVQSSYSEKNLSVKLAVCIKGIWKIHECSALRLHRRFSQPATVWITQISKKKLQTHLTNTHQRKLRYFEAIRNLTQIKLCSKTKKIYFYRLNPEKASRLFCKSCKSYFSNKHSFGKLKISLGAIQKLRHRGFRDGVPNINDKI